MEDKQRPTQNRLALYRRRIGYSQNRVAHLLGYQSRGLVSGYELGLYLPGLEPALGLEIILRTPVAFLYPELYDRLKAEIRAEEERLAGKGQQTLFDHYPMRL